MKVYFPKDVGQKYYHAHYKFVYDLLKSMNLDVELYKQEHLRAGCFILKINGKRILIDFWDLSKLVEDTDDFDACFKFHYSREYCDENKNVYPLCPISFYDWDEYSRLEKEIKYKCNTDLILNSQIIQHRKDKKRADIREILRDKYGDLVDTKITSQQDFWMKINSCLISVCVPTQRKDILDRGQFQYMAFGACTISPRLKITLPYMKPLKPGVHYIECADDYSDLIKIIEWCKEHRIACIQIGKNAKRLFSETSTPSAIWRWMCMVLKGNNETN